MRKVMKSGMQPPFSGDDIRGLIAQLPRSEMERLIKNSRTLLETLYDRRLMHEIIDVVEHLIARMKQRPKVYSATQISALETGLAMIKQGNLLFDELSGEDCDRIFEVVVQIEMDALEDIYANYN